METEYSCSNQYIYILFLHYITFLDRENRVFLLDSAVPRSYMELLMSFTCCLGFRLCPGILLFLPILLALISIIFRCNR